MMIQASAYILSFPVDFKLSRFRIIYSHHFVVQLMVDGISGAGSGVLYRSTVWNAYQYWETLAHPLFQSTSLDTLFENRLSYLSDLIRAEPGIAFAVDTAVLDLIGKQKNQSVASLLGNVARTEIPMTEQLFISQWDKSKIELEEILKRGTKRLKIKTGFSPEEDMALLKKVRQFVGSEIEIGIDANRAYSLQDSIDLYRRMEDEGVVLLEEPINDPNLDTLHQLREAVKIPVMLDESILSVDDLEKAIQAEALDFLNIKLTRVGGLSIAKQYQQLCQNAGVGISIGCNEDIGPGMASLLHFSAVQTQHAGTEGVGNLRLGADIIQEQMVIENGRLSLPDGPGLGVNLVPNLAHALPKNVHLLDLQKTKPARVRPFSFYLRNRQRAATAVYRLQRRLGR